MNFKNDLRELIVKEFDDRYGIACTHTNDVYKLLCNSLNTHQKLISTNIRKVHISNELKKRNIPQKIKDICAELKVKFQKGDDVNPHLSRWILNSDKPDPLLNDWGLHHIHLDNEKENESGYFFKRADFLLFVLVGESEVYFIDIVRHNTNNVFSRKDLLRIINNNWPEILEPHVMRITGSGSTYSDKDIDELRKAGINTVIEIDGKCILSPGGGISLVGTNFPHTMQAKEILKRIEELESIVRNNSSKMVTNPPNVLDYKLLEYTSLENKSVSLVKEVNTGLYINIIQNHKQGQFTWTSTCDAGSEDQFPAEEA